ncbi:hypothetical protein VC83_04952 [Pseudogymnoascus destructans]|uniref:Uncharacterized protein n=2 Tax=Pseudogymnoascus destructans TaxID=655981 RepID=L8FQ17_PSED2|nr:uncharacterized protein VC83_04952 [Pseudogymnoascus destructans]ELR01806.1 hypothetical protein GMDG_00906 [Pseudogymnoascus destructans 20631-21]OAF58611.1 hypothetical protein VC83_04952 [Pseudogymnoascus destructans]
MWSRNPYADFRSILRSTLSDPARTKGTARQFKVIIVISFAAPVSANIIIMADSTSLQSGRIPKDKHLKGAENYTAWKIAVYSLLFSKALDEKANDPDFLRRLLHCPACTSALIPS